MTPADEATFIALWSQGLSQDAIAQRLGIPIGTVKSRAHTLAHAGKLTPRPRGGAYPRQKALARLEAEETPARAPAPATPPRADIKQWTVRLSQALIEAVKAQATTEGKEPRHLVEEVLWQALSDHRASTL